ncbi:SURF1 family protein [Nocardioides vastitatis]|uniref:SURF1-like protein n=2 Tax=Nocardioides TaxID=1839 RepID=A0ABW0ZL07_9ACTN|nr:SURF1 family protein [Nocardioides sp.]
MWGAHLLGLICVAAATGMGVWQHDAWQERRAAERVDLTEAEPVPLAEVLGPDDPFPAGDVGRPVRLAGTWLPEGTALVTGREDEDGRAGRWVVTPLTVGGPADPAVPVVRGWVPDDTDVADLPAPDPGEAELVGWLQPPEGSGMADDDPSDDVLPQLRIADIVQRVDQDLYGAYVVARAPTQTDAAAGLAPATLDQLPPAGRFTALRNLLYAIEWWVFAAFAGFIWWRYVRDATRLPPAQEAGAGDDPEDAVLSGE